jgi:MFS transporter, MHS family, alpha-ketoglutarate permease
MSGATTTSPSGRFVQSSPQKSTRRYLSLGGGMALEAYDWGIYALMAAFLAPHFFPSDDRLTSTLSALAVFAVGFVIRPISAAIFGPVADRIGHKKVLLVSISVMAVCTLLLGLMPTYDQIGPWAGIFVLLIRLIQGFSYGVELPATSAAALELAPPGRQGFFSTIIGGTFNQAGNLLASLVALIVSTVVGADGMADWGWRVPFILGGIAGVVVLFMRRNMPETGAAVATNHKVEKTSMVWAELWKHRLGLLAIIFVVGGTQIANYTWTAGLPNLAISGFKEDPSHVFAITTGLSVLMVACGPVSGWLADKYGSPIVFKTLRTLLIPAYFLILLYNNPGIGMLAAVAIGGGVIVSLNQVLFNYVTATLMPAQCRTTGVAIGYGIGVALFGGTASYLLLWFRQQDALWMFVVYGAVICLLSVIIYAWAHRRGHVHTKNSKQSVAQPAATI